MTVAANVEHGGTSRGLVPGRPTGPLMIFVGLASAVFTVGTALHAFVIVTPETLERMMVLAGADPGGVDGFLSIFRAVGVAYIIGNAVGVWALRRRPSMWLFWVVIGVNATQAAGLLMVPPEMFTAARERFGSVGVLPSLVTDGGAAVVVIVLLGSLAATRTVWGRVR
ncbi:hypothetical protein EV641_111117 [Rhodococcus sp. SMB37]|uniref:hypothetical protein n=1 Tax=Rhodococcus sp. SMB37 TaxID=2512213 RepID=UPI0010EBDB8C|nr:hypothetical protein [Rhodococcus sp. SMB37]TCN50841.1 hypothetical protein EV641_111117 [Rhodococcus sp. SMB37]